MTSGYSGTPLAKKLGLKEGFTIRLIDPPSHYFELFEVFPAGIQLEEGPEMPKDLVHYFTTEAMDLINKLADLKN